MSQKFKQSKSAKYKDTKVIVIDEEEIKRIEELKLDKPHLINARKWLIIGINTGQRVNELLSINKSMFKIDNGGISKHRGEESDSVNYSDVDRMMSKINDRSEFYTRRFLDYICDNSNKYPEYNNTDDSDMYPDKDANNFSSFVL